MPYDPKRIESSWQAYWLENETFRVEIDTSKPKYYVLDMFPYPSGDGLHVGHPEGYTATDIMARYKRMRGFNVLHPMGWDAFGLPAEQYAIKTGTHPRVTTRRNVDNFRRQIRSLGRLELSQILRGEFLDEGSADATVNQAIDRGIRILQQGERFETRKVDLAIPVRLHVDRATTD